MRATHTIPVSISFALPSEISQLPQSQQQPKYQCTFKYLRYEGGSVIDLTQLTQDLTSSHTISSIHPNDSFTLSLRYFSSCRRATSLKLNSQQILTSLLNAKFRPSNKVQLSLMKTGRGPLDYKFTATLKV